MATKSENLIHLRSNLLAAGRLQSFRYRIVDSMSDCPSHCCTVRRSTPAQRHRVANVARKLCSQAQ